MDLDTEFSGREVGVLVSAVLTAIAAFLPWVVAGAEAGPVEVSATSSGIEGLGLLTLLIAIIVAGIIITRKFYDREVIAVSAGGLLIVLVAGWKIVDLAGPADPGNGLYLTLLGGAGIVAAGVWEHTSGSD